MRKWEKELPDNIVQNALADVQLPVAEFATMWDLREAFDKEMKCKLSRNAISFVCMGMGWKLDIWPVYETWEEGRPPELGGTPRAERDQNKPYISQKYWTDDNMPAAEIIDAVTVPFGDFEARVPAKGRYYIERLYGKNVMTMVKVWNDEFNRQHCNNCNWSPNSFAIRFALFDHVYAHYKRDQRSVKLGCGH